MLLYYNYELLTRITKYKIYIHYFKKVFQRRVDGSVNFYRVWNEYKYGFGFLSQEFWLGNEKLSYLTNQKNYQLRIDLINSLGSSYYALYDIFRISNERNNYKLVSLGSSILEQQVSNLIICYIYNINRLYISYIEYIYVCNIVLHI